MLVRIQWERGIVESECALAQLMTETRTVGTRGVGRV